MNIHSFHGLTMRMRPGPGIIGVLGFRLEDPVEVAFAGVDEVGEVDLDKGR